MQFITQLKDRAQELVQENATTILTAGGVVGTVATGVLAGRAGIKAERIIRNEELDRAIEQENQTTEQVPVEPLSKTDKVKLVWPLFIPPVVSGGITVTSIVMANRMSAQKAAAMAAAYGLSEKHFREYRAKVEEKLTGPKAQSIDDELAQDQVNNTPGHHNLVVIEGDVLCFEAYAGRYFHSSMEAMNRSINDVNDNILNFDSASLSELYSMLGLPPTEFSDDVGWNMDHRLKVKFSTTLTDTKRPCIVMHFVNQPRADYKDRNRSY